MNSTPKRRHKKKTPYTNYVLVETFDYPSSPSEASSPGDGAVNGSVTLHSSSSIGDSDESMDATSPFVASDAELYVLGYDGHVVEGLRHINRVCSLESEDTKDRRALYNTQLRRIAALASGAIAGRRIKELIATVRVVRGTGAETCMSDALSMPILPLLDADIRHAATGAESVLDLVTSLAFSNPALPSHDFQLAGALLGIIIQWRGCVPNPALVEGAFALLPGPVLASIYPDMLARAQGFSHATLSLFEHEPAWMLFVRRALLASCSVCDSTLLDAIVKHTPEHAAEALLRGSDGISGEMMQRLLKQEPSPMHAKFLESFVQYTGYVPFRETVYAITVEPELAPNYKALAVRVQRELIEGRAAPKKHVGTILKMAKAPLPRSEYAQRSSPLPVRRKSTPKKFGTDFLHGKQQLAPVRGMKKPMKSTKKNTTAAVVKRLVAAGKK